MIGMAALVAIIRGLRGDKHMGNFYVDLWRGTAYFFVPLCLVVGVLADGRRGAMTLDGARRGDTRWNPERWGRTTAANRQLQQIARGPGGGDRRRQAIRHQRRRLLRRQHRASVREPECVHQSFDLRRHHSAAGGDAWSCSAEMLKRYRHAAVIFGVMLVLSWRPSPGRSTATRCKPNPGLDRPCWHDRTRSPMPRRRTANATWCSLR